MGRIRKLTVLSGTSRGPRRMSARGHDDETGRRQRLTGIRNPGGVRRHLFGVGEGPAEAVAEAKQESTGVMRKQVGGELVTEHWPLNGSTQAGVRNKMRNNDLRLGYGHASVALRSPS